MPFSKRKDYFAKQILEKSFLIPLFFVMVTIPSSSAFAATVNLAWDPPASSDIAGYYVYYGTSSKNYTGNVKVGKTTNCSIPNLTEGRKYYFAATAFNTSNVESAPSNELSYTIPTASSGTTGGSGTTGTTSGSTPSSTTGSSGTVIIDNGGSGTKKSGTWKVSSGVNYYGSKSEFSNTVPSTYSFEAARSGYQKVYLRWTNHNSRYSAVPVIIYNGSTSLGTVNVDQTKNGGTWQLLGTYNFSGQAKVVVVSETSSNTTCADAVQFVPTSATTSSGTTSGSGTTSPSGTASGSGTTSPSGSTSGSGTTNTTGSTSGSTPSGTTGSSSTIIIDNGDSGTEKTGSWSVSSGPNYYGSKSEFSRTVNSTYTFKTARSGYQKVYLRWTAHNSRYSDVPVNLYNGSTLIDTIYVDQSIEKDGGTWQLLGTYNFSGQAKVIIVSDSSSKTTCADAVQFIPTSTTTSSGSTSGSGTSGSTPAGSSTSAPSAASSGSTIVDNGDPGTKATGNWRSSGGAGFYGSKSLYSATADDTYSFEASCSGLREVFLWWTEYANRCENVDVDIYDGTKFLETVTISSQKINGGQWNKLGTTYSFSGKARVIINSNGGCTTCADAVNFFDPN